jgi:hypothetical protein
MEEKIRKVLGLCEPVLQIVHNGDVPFAIDVTKALDAVIDLKKELGFIEDKQEPKKLKQLKINFNG